MKSVISALFIFVLIIILSIISSCYINNSVDEMLQQVYENEKYIAQNNWEEVKNGVESIKKIWDSRKTVSSFFLNHASVDLIDASIEKQINSVTLREKSVFYYENNKFMLLINSLKEQQKISFENVF